MFQQNKVCCVSDIHIGVHQNSAIWHDIAISWSRWLRDELKREKIHDIIICGDLFHYRDEIAVNTIQVVTEILENWSSFNILVLVGNHDAFYKDRADINSLSILRGWSNITVVDKLTQIHQFGRDFLFCPWGTKSAEITKNDIIFGHFEIESFKMNHFKVCTEGIKTKDLLKKSDLIITGHFHHREERVYKNGKILYIGNPYQMDFGDVGTMKGYYILDMKTSEYQFTQNTLSPSHIKIKLSDLARVGTIDEEYKNIIGYNIIKFIIDRNIMPDEAEYIIHRLLRHKPKIFNVDYSINFNKFNSPESDRDLSGVDIPTAIREFVSELDIDNIDSIIEYTIDLYKRCK